jgi:hypothetical protein
MKAEGRVKESCLTGERQEAAAGGKGSDTLTVPLGGLDEGWQCRAFAT